MFITYSCIINKYKNKNKKKVSKATKIALKIFHQLKDKLIQLKL